MKMSYGDRLISVFSPGWALSRVRHRHALAAYEAAKPSRLRALTVDNGSGDAVVGRAGPALRGYARQLDQNYDVARGALDVLVNNTIGPFGIHREPLPRSLDGKIHREFAAALTALWNDWKKLPEVTWDHDYASMERLACRTWLRDGEHLAQMVIGTDKKLNHGTTVPFSVELIEADHLPFELDDDARGITQGVERNAWGRTVAFHVYKNHPGGVLRGFDLTTRRVSSDMMLHMKMTDRFRQARGVSVFAAVMRRLEDLKDYEESERIAARVAAAMTGYIKKGAAEEYEPPQDSTQKDRAFSMKPGMIFDGLQPGEEVGTIASNRPSGLLAPFHSAMLRSVAAGMRASYSSLSKNYNGTYSAQRQELVEGWLNYQALTQLWIGQFSRPVWEWFVHAAVLSGAVKVPGDLDRSTMTNAAFRGPAMPWIDPQKEIAARGESAALGYRSPQQNIHEMGGSVSDVLDEHEQWRDELEARNLTFGSSSGKQTTQPETPAAAGVSDSEDDKNATTGETAKSPEDV
jgi:lambda family phage portal protein